MKVNFWSRILRRPKNLGKLGTASTSVLLALLGLLLIVLRRKTGLALIVASVAGIFLLSMPVVATTLAGLLENRVEGRDRIALVTHALHMRRARLVFEQAGFRVIEAPTGFSTLRPPGILNYLPSAQGLDVSAAVFHEAIGLGWYHVHLAARGQRGQQ